MQQLLPVYKCTLIVICDILDHVLTKDVLKRITGEFDVASILKLNAANLSIDCLFVAMISVCLSIYILYLLFSPFHDRVVFNCNLTN